VFFFQAEDGIRDDLVTGVQTCALPIWIRTLKDAQDLLGRMHDLEVLIARTRGIQSSPGASTLKVSADLDRLVRRLETECRQLHRSEERRVGKQWRSRWWRESKENNIRR